MKDKASKLKVKKMKELIDLYEQVENVKPKSSRLIVENHIEKLEEEIDAINSKLKDMSEVERRLVQILEGVDER